MKLNVKLMLHEARSFWSPAAILLSSPLVKQNSKNILFLRRKGRKRR
jgi:hypothetical protein